MKETPWLRIRRQNSVTKNPWRLLAMGVQRAVFKRNNCSFRHDINKRAKMTQPNPSPNSFMQQDEKKASKTRSPRGRSPSGRMFSMAMQGLPQRNLHHFILLKVHPPECWFYKTKSGCRSGESARMHIVRLMNNLVNGPKRMMTKVQWLC